MSKSLVGIAPIAETLPTGSPLPTAILFAPADSLQLVAYAHLLVSLRDEECLDCSRAHYPGQNFRCPRVLQSHLCCSLVDSQCCFHPERLHCFAFDDLLRYRVRRLNCFVLGDLVCCFSKNSHCFHFDFDIDHLQIVVVRRSASSHRPALVDRWFDQIRWRHFLSGFLVTLWRIQAPDLSHSALFGSVPAIT